MTTPTVHSNGTSAAMLVAELSDAYAALNDAYAALKRTAPNMRDYYVKPDFREAFNAADAEHMGRLQRIDDVMKELEQLMEGIQSQADERNRTAPAGWQSV